MFHFFFQFPRKIVVVILLFTFLRLLFTPLEFFLHQLTLMVFQWSLSDSKSPQVSRTLLSILAILNNAVIWKVSTRPLTSKLSSPFNSPLVSVSNYYYYYYYYSTPMWVFHNSVSWWFIHWSLSDASLLKSPELFLVFWLISTMLWSYCYCYYYHYYWFSYFIWIYIYIYIYIYVYIYIYIYIFVI